MKKVFVVEGARTPFTAFCGSLKNVNATQLGVAAGKEAIERSGFSADDVQQLVIGNVIHSSSQAAYLSRHIGLKCGIPEAAPALTVNRLCGSGLQAVISASQDMMMGMCETALAGGAENMSMSPHADFKTRANGAKYGAITYEDMLLQTLTDHHAGCGMGETAENLAEKYNITREAQDEAARVSHLRAAAARDSGRFAREIVTVDTGRASIGTDEHIRSEDDLMKLADLKAAFKKNGTVTAGNASGINDGAAAMFLATEEKVKEYEIKPLAEIVSWGVSGVDPTLMGIGPVPASRRALKQAGLKLDTIDLVEINEAFSAQLLAVLSELGLSLEKTNVNGGAVALGHPVGASGARILLSLAYELKQRGLRYGLASLCIGGGQGIAVIIKNPEV